MLREAPVEVRLAILVGAAGGLLFLAEGLLRWQGDGDGAWVKFPLIVLVLELLAVAGLLARLRPARLTTAVVYGVVALVHLLAVLNQGPVWVRVVAGVLSAGHVFGVVVLNTRPARLYFGAPR
ncbi:hypothetical protein [Saccharothrix obliqua]|uniref:hypothetical protein n=1 Tax=Saccharothrix obliqua TaxID=2861747 RepID=UPI001C5E43E8|nr:hypothetical protein [Saccharothrix obliqua]MBW4720052.1 hypothetical protein [Saccharothrix obliqua]